MDRRCGNGLESIAEIVLSAVCAVYREGASRCIVDNGHLLPLFVAEGDCGLTLCRRFQIHHHFVSSTVGRKFLLFAREFIDNRLSAQSEKFGRRIAGNVDFAIVFVEVQMVGTWLAYCQLLIQVIKMRRLSGALSKVTAA